MTQSSAFRISRSDKCRCPLPYALVAPVIIGQNRDVGGRRRNRTCKGPGIPHTHRSMLDDEDYLALEDNEVQN